MFLKTMNTKPVNTPVTLGPLILAAVVATIAPIAARAATIDINPSKDNTLYEYVASDGDRSNALGDHFFAGMTAQAEIRRGVIAFDIAGNIPAGSTITSVTLTLNMSRTISGDETVELHKLLADWGEGTSNANSEEGQGAPATPNDATWRHRFYDTVFWTNMGGDFSLTTSASQVVGDIGLYVWTSAQMVADVQSWLDDPTNNFGWLVLGDESTSPTSKRFDTRESATPPVLTVEYTEPAPFTLSAQGRKVQGINTVRLSWSGATSNRVDIYRDAARLGRVRNTGTLTDSTGDTGRARYTYRVCEAGTSTCSNTVAVRFRQ
jgi:hypothetical protein